jgi:phosphoadenosine phosphosulfate reductase
MSLVDRIHQADQVLDQALSCGLRACATTSFQTDGMVLIHLLRRRLPDLPVLFVDTDYHFPEVYAYRDRMASEFGLNIVNLKAKQTVPEQESQYGVLYNSSPDLCCHMRKVEPLHAGLAEYDMWFSALRREQSPSRVNLKVFDNFALHNGKMIRKISPMASWTTRDVWEYLKAFDIPILPLYERGYQSIGCQPCTSLPLDADNPRSGRWGGTKLECGIHVPNNYHENVVNAANSLVQIQAAS